MKDNINSSALKLVISANAPGEEEEIFLGSINLDTPKLLMHTPKEFLEFLENNNISGCWRTETDWEGNCLRSSMKLYGLSVHLEFTADL